MPRFASRVFVCAATTTCLLAFSPGARAQSAAPTPDAAKNPLVASIAGLHSYYAGIILKSADEMPESNYGFRPTPDVRTYGAILAHIADGEYEFCSPAKGEPSPQSTSFEKTATTKAAIATALHTAFAYCDAVYAGLSDAQLGDSVKFFNGNRSRLFVLAAGLGHTEEHYGNLVTYLRMKGLVPPTSARPPKATATR